MNIKDTVSLTPKTRKAKNSLQNKCNLWSVVGFGPAQCFDGRDSVQLQEIREDDRIPAIKNLEFPIDKDFDIVL